MLVNALLESPHASPVDVDVATSASLHLVPQTEDLPVGQVELMFSGTPHRIPAVELNDWVTATGRYVTDRSLENLPTSAVVPVATDPLGGATVIDTPGTGGLRAAHGEMAVRTAHKACVLVVVADASAPLTAPEMDLIKQTTATLESVIVVVTKTDKNLRRWRTIVEQDQRLLAEHLGRTVPVLGVSSVRGLAACDFEPGPRREAYLRSSGVVALRELLRERLDRGEEYGIVDGMRTAVEGLRNVHGKIAQDIKVTKENVKAIPALTEERERLKQLREHNAEWEMHFNRDMTLVRQNALEHLDRRLSEIREKWTNWIQSHGMEVLRKSPQLFTAEIETDLMAALGATLDECLTSMHKIVEPLFTSPEPWAAAYQQMGAVLRRPETLGVSEVASKKQGVFDPTVMSMGLSGSSIATAVLGATAGVAVAPIGAAAAVAWIGVNLVFRAMRSSRQNLINWMRETTGNTKTTASRMLEAAIVAGRTELVLRYRADLRERTEEVTKRLTDAQNSAKQDAAEREKSLQRMTRNAQTVTEAVAELESAITRYAALSAAPASTGRHAAPAIGTRHAAEVTSL
jgi:hypothetical protein